MNDNYFGKVLKSLLKDMGITQKELCDEIGVSYSNMCHFIKGHTTPGFKMAEKIAAGLNVSVGIFSEQNAYEIPGEIQQEIRDFIVNPHNIEWIALAKRLKDSGLMIQMIEAIIELEG